MAKNQKINVQYNDVVQKVYVIVRKKHKLTDLYPQRALLEEARKNSSLIQANDWIDHDYYERLVEQSEQSGKRIDKKYGPKLPSQRQVEIKPMTKTYKVPEFDPQVKRL